MFAGILPKIDNAFAAIDAGVKEVLIGDANDLIQNTTVKLSGTLITLIMKIEDLYNDALKLLTAINFYSFFFKRRK